MSNAASIKLSQGIKALIASPRARGSSIPSPGQSALYDLFRRVRSKGEKKGGVDKETWMTVLTAGIMTVNSPSSLCGLYDYASEGVDLEGKVENAAIMREVGLKCISFNGIPRTINGLGALRSHLPEEVTAKLGTSPLRELTPSNVEDTLKRGRALWDDIYEPHSSKLLSKLSDSHPDLPVHILTSHYSHVLSDPFQESPSGGYKIGRILTSIVAMTCLRAQGGVGPQVTSHVFGLKKGLLPNALGRGEEKEVKGEEWLGSDEGVEWILESADEVSEVIAGGEVSFAGGLKRESKL